MSHKRHPPSRFYDSLELITQSTRASFFSLSTSRAAISLAPPSKNSVAAFLGGTYTLEILWRGDNSGPPNPRSAAVSLRIGLFLAAIIPFNVAYRGLLIPDWIVSTAGSGISIH